MWARIHLIPALQAEEDRDQVRRYLADRAREKELLGTETRVYHSDRYVCIISMFDMDMTNIVAQICSTNIRGYTRGRDEINKQLQETIGYLYIQI